MALTDMSNRSTKSAAGQPPAQDGARDGSLRLRDGRQLGYREYGRHDGTPVLFFHGLGTSRVICPIDQPLADSLGVRLVAVDRPGIGLSDPQRGRRLLDFTSDVAELADALEFDRIAVVGWSGGGPYAAACAFRLPDRVRVAGVISAPAPIAGGEDVSYLRRFHRTAAISARRAPWTIRLALWHWGRPQRRNAEEFFDRSFAEMGRADQQVLAEPKVRQQMIDNSAELYRHGGRGMYDEAILLARPWGFDLRDIRVPVHIWHGEKDETVPVVMARHLADVIPTSMATIYPDEGHHLLYRRWPEILAALI